jgi:histidine triad (HIT) family protein
MAAPSVDAACVFCRITGVGEARVVMETADVVALLDHRPLFPGHCLVIPREHVATLEDLPAEAVAPLFEAVQRTVVGVRRATGADGTFVAMNNRVSQSVPHLHVHVVPRRFKDGLRGFFWPRTRYESDAAMDEMRELIRQHIPATQVG